MLYNILFIKRNKNQAQPKILLTDFIVISILGICGLICYYLYDSFVYHKIITLAIVVFVIGLIAIMIYSSLQDSKLKKKMMKERELFKELSYKEIIIHLYIMYLMFMPQSTLVAMVVNEKRRASLLTFLLYY